VEGCIQRREVDIALKNLKKDGFTGLYKGFGIPMITFSPTNIIWWGNYNSSRHVFSHFNQLDDEIAWKKSYFLQASSGFLAGESQVALHNPLTQFKLDYKYLLYFDTKYFSSM
jgi:solute carrier family 25 protein 44